MTTTTGTTGTAPYATNLSGASTKPPNNEMGKDAFLKLLVAQLRYQDPMNPADGTEFISQTAQFTVVERLENLVKQNEELMASQNAIAGSSLVGREVSWKVKDQLPGGDGSAPPADWDGDGVDDVATGVVKGLRLTPEGPVLLVDDAEVPLKVLTEIRPAPAAPAPAATPPVAPPATNASTDERNGTDAVDTSVTTTTEPT